MDEVRELDEGEYVVESDVDKGHNHKFSFIQGDITLRIDYTIGFGDAALYFSIYTASEGGGNYIAIEAANGDDKEVSFNSFEEIERCINDFKTKYKLLIPNSKLI